MKYSLKEAGMPYQYILLEPQYIVVALKHENYSEILVAPKCENGGFQA